MAEPVEVVCPNGHSFRTTVRARSITCRRDGIALYVRADGTVAPRKAPTPPPAEPSGQSAADSAAPAPPTAAETVTPASAPGCAADTASVNGAARKPRPAPPRSDRWGYDPATGTTIRISPDGEPMTYPPGAPLPPGAPDWDSPARSPRSTILPLCRAGPAAAPVAGIRTVVSGRGFAGPGDRSGGAVLAGTPPPRPRGPLSREGAAGGLAAAG